MAVARDSLGKDKAFRRWYERCEGGLAKPSRRFSDARAIRRATAEAKYIVLRSKREFSSPQSNLA